MPVDLKKVLQALKNEIGSNAKVAEALGYSEKTVQDWLSKDGELELNPEKRKNILTLAGDYGLEPDRHSPGPMLWDPRLTLDDNSKRELPHPPTTFRPFLDHKVTFLGHQIGSPLGVGPCALTSTVGHARFWFQSGVDVVTLRTVRSYSLAAAGVPNLYVGTGPINIDGESVVESEVTSWDEARIGDGLYSLWFGSSPEPLAWREKFRAASLHRSSQQLLIQSVIGGGTQRYLR